MDTIKTVFIIGPQHYDYSVAAIIQGLNKVDGVRVFSNSEHNHCMGFATQLATQVELCRMADVVMLAHSALEPKYMQSVQPLLSQVKPDVFLDGSDYSEYEANPKDYRLYLKRELDPTQRPIEDNVEPFIFAAEDRFFIYTTPWSHALGRVWDNENAVTPADIHKSVWEQKTQKLACIMTACDKRPWRFNVLNKLNECYEDDEKAFVGELRTGDTHDGLDTGERHFSGYFAKLFDSKISVDSWGCGAARQTGRFWESLANGCLVFYQPIKPYIWTNTFIEGEHFVVYNSADELVDKLKYYEENDDEARQIAEKGFCQLVAHHTTLERSNEFLSLCKQYL